MDNYEKVKELYRSGRYECDNYFYTELKEILEFLNLNDFLPPVLHNKGLVDQIESLTKEHLRILESEDDEEAALQVIHQINDCIKKIDGSSLPSIFEAIEKMGGKGYEERVILLIKAQSYRKPYLEVLDHIIKSVHTAEMRTEQILLVYLFFSKNSDKLEKFVNIFKVVLENGVQELRKFRERRDFIESHPQIETHPKVDNFIKGSQVLLSRMIRFNEIYKIISGDSRYGLKINAARKDIEGMNKGVAARLPPIDYGQVKSKLLEGEPMGSMCSFCMTPAEADHPECRGVIKMLYVQN